MSDEKLKARAIRVLKKNKELKQTIELLREENQRLQANNMYLERIMDDLRGVMRRIGVH